MAMSIEECDLSEWAEQAMKITSYQGDMRSFISANIFSSMQFIESEVELKKQHKAFKLTIEEGAIRVAIAWMSIYFLSDRVLRIRGLYTHQSYRNRGAMTFLLQGVLKMYQGRASRVLSFSRPSTISFHRKNKFEIESRFTPRKTGYDQSAEKMTLLTYDLQARLCKR